MPDLKIYGRENCSGCKAAKQLADNKQIKYKYIDIDQDEISTSFLRDRGLSNLPAVFVDEKYIGTFPDLFKLVAKGEFN